MRTILTMQNVVYIIISNIPPTVYIRYTAFWNFSKLLFVLHILAVTKFLHRWCAPCSQCQRYFKSSFPTLRKLCIWDFQRFQIVRNCSSFPHFEFYEIFTAVMCTMLIIVNFFLNPHFFHCAHCVNKIYSVLEAFDIAVCFCIFLRLRNIYSGDGHHTNYGKHSLNHHFRHFANCVWDSQCFRTFGNCSLFCIFWRLRNFYYGDAHRANYAKHSLNHYFQDCAHCVSEIFTVFKLIEITFGFAHFGFYEVSTPVMRTLPTRPKIA